jgi:hypothetical protein
MEYQVLKSKIRKDEYIAEESYIRLTCPDYLWTCPDGTFKRFQKSWISGRPMNVSGRPMNMSWWDFQKAPKILKIWMAYECVRTAYEHVRMGLSKSSKNHGCLNGLWMCQDGLWTCLDGTFKKLQKSWMSGRLMNVSRRDRAGTLT